MANKKKKQRKTGLLIKILFVAFLCYVAVVFVQLRIQINEKQKQLDEMKDKVAAQQLQNEELASLLHQDIDEEYIEKMARALGYGHPGERVYENITGK